MALKHLKAAASIAFILTTVVGVYILRQELQKLAPPVPDPSAQAMQNMRYVKDDKTGVCFGITWTEADDKRNYIITWVPCWKELPVANKPTGGSI